MPKLRVLKVGADPEALFFNAKGRATAATEFVGNRSGVHSSWIGVDGHSFTAELRPLPFNSVFRHARNIAEAICAIDEHALKKQEAFMVAQPFVEGPNEPLGGHIHVSFTLHDPVAVPAMLGGWVLDVMGSLTQSLSVATYTVLSNRSPFVQSYLSARRNGEPVFGLDHLKSKLHQLVAPLEAGLYPPSRRASRRYGNGGDVIRADHGRPTLINPTTLKWRMEYRFPSTWLCHPALALLYLASAKLAVNNYHLPLDPNTSAFDYDSIDRHNMQSVLQSRQAHILGHEQAVLTEDTAPLPKLLKYVMTQLYPKLQESLVKIDTEAWREFYEQGRWK